MSHPIFIIIHVLFPGSHGTPTSPENYIPHSGQWTYPSNKHKNTLIARVELMANSSFNTVKPHAAAMDACFPDMPKVFRIEMFVLKTHTPHTHTHHNYAYRMGVGERSPSLCMPVCMPAHPPNVMITIKSITSKTLINTTFICKMHYRRGWRTHARPHMHVHPPARPLEHTGTRAERQRMRPPYTGV